VQGLPFEEAKDLAPRLAREGAFADWPLVVLVDDLDEATKSSQLFLWTTFTRMEPAADIYGAQEVVSRFHVGLEPPVVFDCRMKPWYPDVMEVDDATRDLVDNRWDQYGIKI